MNDRLRVLALAGLALLTACGADDATESQPTPEASGPVPLVSGIDTDGMDPSVGAGDDFYRHVNGTWLAETEIPADRSNFGTFTVLVEESEAASREIIEAAAADTDAPGGSTSQKVGAFYRAFMDEQTVEARGMDPVRPQLAAIDAIETREDLIRFMGDVQNGSMRVPMSFWVAPDYKDTTRYTIYLTQWGLGLPNRDYYDQAQFADKKDAYGRYIGDLLALAGIEDAAGTAEAVLDLETAMAASQWTPTQNRDRVATYNPYSLAELEEFAADFDWPTYLEAAGLEGRLENVVIRQPSYAEALAELVRTTPLEVWKDYLRVHLLDDAAPYLSSDFVDLNFAFRGRTLNGIDENRPRWKRAVAATEDALGEAVGELYVAEHFPPEAKARMQALVGNLVRAFEASIDELAWMSEATREEAHAKLARFTPKIGYPDEWRDYSALEVEEGVLYENRAAANAFEYRRQIDRLGGPIDRGEWLMTPMTVNAYYYPPLNEIVFPAAILQPPFFNMAADDAVNYGAIGAVIGHEISHGFDDQGRKTDGNGLLRDWWTEADAAAFEARAAELGGQYDGYCPFEDACVKGDFTMGENIGDLAGVTMAYRAYRMSLNGAEAPVIDGLTGDQRFFMGYAQVWRRLYRDDNLRMRLSTDPHSPSEYRTNGIVRNLDAWYAAFGVEEGDALYLPPEERVAIW